MQVRETLFTQWTPKAETSEDRQPREVLRTIQSSGSKIYSILSEMCRCVVKTLTNLMEFCLVQTKHQAADGGRGNRVTFSFCRIGDVVVLAMGRLAPGAVA
ncbi:hypothetical protein BgiMline_008472 [Biomphalaria glabrata]|nr:hypothetical protein BgiBS90_033966 [Biomphalaria glabrata]KAI8747552.1 hypothetical protein BgiMline_019270 [Biomphalaria glabrata]